MKVDMDPTVEISQSSDDDDIGNISKLKLSKTFVMMMMRIVILAILLLQTSLRT